MSHMSKIIKSYIITPNMNKNAFIFTSFIALIGCYLRVHGELWDEKQALLEFLQNTPHSRYIDWSLATPMCTTWTGVTCNNQQSMVVALRLPGFGFRGSIPNDTISRLAGLQTLSLRNNMISGRFPFDFLKLRNLTSLYLQSNKFFGPLPLNMSLWSNISVFNLSNNNFNGSIPNSFLSLSKLTTLDLSSNLFSGEIPDFGTTSLRFLNLSRNHLNGTLPRSLSRFPSSSFFGNNVSYDVSIPPLPSDVSPVIQRVLPHKSKGKLSETTLLGIILGVFALVFVLIAILLGVFYSKRVVLKRQKEEKKAFKKGKMAKDSQEEKNGRMAFFEGSKLAFDLEDLLRASAEILGKGTFGTTYKATLEDSTIVVVKRLKEMSIGKREFEHQMELVGDIKHENVVALRAYFCSKDEKLMVYDYYSSGSLSAMLHGKRRENTTPLDWETRLNIVIGVAKGLAHIHTQNNGKLVHGNIRSSNIFLNNQNHGCVSDLGLAALGTPLSPLIQRVTGYQAPELTDPRKATQPSDVYSFGVLVLELLTGKCPLEEGVSLVRWVNSVVREEWTAEVFDVELSRYTNVEEEMVTMLQLGMVCAERAPERRPKMWEVVRMVDDLRRGFCGTRPSSEVSTPTRASSSHVVEIGSASTFVAQ